MNSKKLVRLSNIIGIISITLLVYWVFVFISITVFGLKVFRENLTETFYLSIVGILALMFGALIINLMFNLTRIADKHNIDDSINNKKSKKIGLLIGISFPIIFGFLYGGDYLSTIKKEKMLISSAKSIIENNSEKTNKILNYSFDKKWINQTSKILQLYSRTDKNFPNVSVIVMDTIDKSQVFLNFTSDYYDRLNDTIPPNKMDFIKETTKVEREYLNQVFLNNNEELRFSSKNGDYELFYPYIKNKKKMVLYFSDYQRYGKLGS